MNPSKNAENNIKCIFCGHISRPHWPDQNVWRCSKCTLIFRYPVPGLDELANYYQKGWKQVESNTRVTGATDLELAQIYCRLLMNALGIGSFRNLRLLEFGSGKGTMLTALSELGAEVYGVDPYSYDFLKGRGHTVFSNLQEIPVGLKFHGVLTIQVIEHLRQPWTTLKEFSEILYDSGWVYISTINAGGLNARFSGSRWREVENPGHLIFFSRETLEMLLADCGYARYEALKNIVNYPGHRMGRRYLSHLLQRLSLNGELRYLVRKS